MQRALLVFVSLVSASPAAWPQGDPLGPEFRVNTYTLLQQWDPSVAFDSSGNFVITWTDYSGHDGQGGDIFGQRYSSAGAALGTEFRINTHTSSNQVGPSVASDQAGNFVVTWNSYVQDGSSWGIFAQRYASGGSPVGSEFRVNSYTISSQGNPSIASDPSGNFVIVWSSDQDGSFHGVFAQRYSNTGVPLGGELRVNTYTTNQQGGPSVASDAAGDFVVAWTGFPDGGAGSYQGVFAQRFANTGVPLGGEFRVNTYTTLFQVHPSVASDSAGNFVVAWQSTNQEAAFSGEGVFAQRYSNTGVPLGIEFRVNSFTANDQREPSVAMDAAGTFVVAWMSYAQDGSDYGVFGQRYANNGAPLGGEFRVNSYTPIVQYIPSVASDPAGNFVVAWTSYTQDGSLQGVFAQRFSMIVPVELQSFRVE